MQQQPSKKTAFTGRGATQGFQKSHSKDTKAAGVAASPAVTREEARGGPQLVTKPPRAKRNASIAVPPNQTVSHYVNNSLKNCYT